MKAFVNFCLIACCFAAMYFQINNGHFWSGDAVSYIRQAQGIVDGTTEEFIKDNTFIVRNSSRMMGPESYPWGFPMLLAPVYATFGVDVFAFKSVCLMFYLFFVILLICCVNRWQSSLTKYCFVGLFVTNPVLTEAPNFILSDLPFLFFSTASVLAIGRLLKDNLASSVRLNILIGILISCAILIRTNGVLLLTTLACVHIILHLTRNSKSVAVHSSRNKFHALGKLIVPYFVVFALLFVCGVFFTNGGASHFSKLEQISLASIKLQLEYYIYLPIDFFEDFLLGGLVFALTIPFATMGVLRKYQDEYHVLIYMISTFVLYVVWPGTQGLRFFYPIIPFYCLFALHGLEAVCSFSRYRSNLLRAACLSPVIVIILCFANTSYENARDNMASLRNTNDGPYTSTSQELFQFVSKTVGPDEIITFYKPRVMNFFSGRMALLAYDIDESLNADYVCVRRGASTHFRINFQEIRRCLDEGTVRLIFENMKYRIYKLDKKKLRMIRQSGY